MRRKLTKDAPVDASLDLTMTKKPPTTTKRATKLTNNKTEQNNNATLILTHNNENINIEQNIEFADKKVNNKKRIASDVSAIVDQQVAKRPKFDSKIKMFQHYQPWVIKTYGDLSKTKTVTLRKYARILRALRGEEVNSADSSKFRFWVKSKGFHIGKPAGYDAKPADGIVGRFVIGDIERDDLSDKDDYHSDMYLDIHQDPALYVPTPPAKVSVLHKNMCSIVFINNACVNCWFCFNVGEIE